MAWRILSTSGKGQILEDQAALPRDVLRRACWTTSGVTYAGYAIEDFRLLGVRAGDTLVSKLHHCQLEEAGARRNELLDTNILAHCIDHVEPYLVGR
eukprot:7939934-Pyramimonas_sp.AAC.1